MRQHKDSASLSRDTGETQPSPARFWIARSSPVFFPALLLLLAFSAAALAGPPVVSNIRASQRASSPRLVDVYYDIQGREPMTVNVTFSNNNGQTWDIVPSPSEITGDYGSTITNGTNRHIIWDPEQKHPEIYWPETRVKILAVNAPGPEKRTIMLPGNVPLELVRVPGGMYSMGSDDGTEWTGVAGVEQPVHTVLLEYDLWVGKYELTQAQYRAIMGSNPSSGYGVGDNYPVYNVSWDDATTTGGFFNLLNNHLAQTNQPPANFRLPSEAEWEYFARGHSTTRFFWGDSDCTADLCASICQLDSYAWYCGNDSTIGTKSVGGKQANPFGLFDVYGNLQELCQDDYQSGYASAPTDGSPLIKPTASSKVTRGGDWNDHPRQMRSTSRYSAPSDYRNYSVGIRIAGRFE